jgi:DNA-directed RNA polymerase subunit N (RpoN/RPB10)
MAEEKPQETPGAGLPGGSAVDTPAGKRVHPQPCWMCGETVGDTYILASAKRFASKGQKTTEALEVIRLHHSCYRNITIVINR